MNALFDLKFTAGLYVIQGFWMLLLVGQILVLITAFYQKRNAVYKVFSIANFCFVFFMLSVLLDGIFMALYLYPVEEYGEYGRPVFPAFVDFVYSLPWLTVVLWTAVETAIVVLCLISGLRYARSHVMESEIKNTVDLLPKGICFGKPDGTILLTNIIMNDWCFAITGDNFVNLNEFIEAVHNKGENQNGNYIVKTDDCTLMFRETRITVDGETFTQLIGADISEQFRITESLRADNAHLLELHNRFKAYSDNLTKLITDREVLAARGVVHSEMGHTLLVSRAYIENPETVDEAELLELLGSTNTLLYNTGRKVGAKETFASAVKRAGKIGVVTELTGELPAEDYKCAVIAHAIDECSANAAKHARAKVLFVDVTEQDGQTVVCFRNDGKQPAREIQESGGLLLLRREVERSGGTMTVQSVPEFKLTIYLI